MVTIESQLPKNIDVFQTGQRLLQKFIEGKFEPPEFVNPNKNLFGKVISGFLSLGKK